MRPLASSAHIVLFKLISLEDLGPCACQKLQRHEKHIQKNMLNTELFDSFGSFHLQLSLHTMIVLECGSTWCNFVFKATLIPPIK